MSILNSQEEFFLVMRANGSVCLVMVAASASEREKAGDTDHGSPTKLSSF